MGGQMVALQDKNGAGAQQVNWVHQDPVTKSQRFTDSAGTVLANKVDLDPWGIETSRSVTPEMQPHLFTSYERDTNKSDEAMMRRYTASRNRFDQPDPFDGSYDLSDPQSFNRYSYVHNDPVNFVDPSGLLENLVPICPDGTKCETISININAPMYNATLERFFRDSSNFGNDNDSNVGGDGPVGRGGTRRPQQQQRAQATVNNDPCSGVNASDLEYFKDRSRKGNKVENGITHITNGHILLDGSKTGILTPSKLPMLAQSKSKYLFQDGTSLEVAQQSIMSFNAFIFDQAKNNHSYATQGNGNIVMSHTFVGPVVDNKGTIYAGVGFDVNKGWLPTSSGTLVLGPDCREVVTSFPGR